MRQQCHSDRRSARGPETARVTADVGTIAEVGTQYTVTFSAAGNTITRAAGSWLADGFAARPDFAIYGTGANGVGPNNQVYKVASA